MSLNKLDALKQQFELTVEIKTVVGLFLAGSQVIAMLKELRPNISSKELAAPPLVGFVVLCLNRLVKPAKGAPILPSTTEYVAVQSWFRTQETAKKGA